MPRAAQRKASFWQISSSPISAGYSLLVASLVAKVGHEQRFAGQGALANTEKLAHDARVGGGAVTHLGFEGDAIAHPVRGTGFGDHRLAGIELSKT